MARMWIGNMCVSREDNGIKFAVEGHSHILRCDYQDLVGMLFVLRGMSESDGGNGYTFQHVIEPRHGYVLQFMNVRKFLSQKEAFILMLALEGAIQNAI